MRVVHLRPAFNSERARLAPRGTAAYDGVVRVLRTLADESVSLVGPEDRAVPHGITIMGRPVPGTDLVVCYVPAGTDVSVVDLVRVPRRSGLRPAHCRLGQFAPAA